MDKIKAIGMMSALAQPTRLDVFLTLSRIGPEGLSVGELAKLMETLPNSMSTHLAILARAGVVTPSRVGRVVTYAVDPDAAKSLAVFLLEGGREA
ncbi:ArsR/SmtB family transcription factor [Novosphingobium rosa]|uniref:ArsR/SmtB family transcription factor n=1 Tax=Novosphingobium rosa TaxID=76978 RepID=UPI000835E845|nr:metalloregulator ArsR/SmtB family transcription factor [Novosphingobium rosa]